MRESLPRMRHPTTLRAMRRLALALPFLLLAACGGRGSSCPPIDQDALADQVADRVIERLRRAAEEQYQADEAAARAAAEEEATRRVRVPVEGAPGIGTESPLVTLVVFSDFQCPFCSRLEPTLAQLLRDYREDVRIYFRHYPLPFHEHARDAAEAAIEAGIQGGDAAFFRYHDALFEHQNALETEDLVRYAVELGLDGERMRRALVTHAHAARVDADLAEGRDAGVQGTPATFVNGRLVSGAQPYDAFAEVIDQELATARAMVEGGVPRDQVYTTLMQAAAAGAAPEAEAEDEEEAEPAADRVYEIPVPRDAPRRGGNRARVVVQVFSDFQCPFCARVVPTLDRLEEEFGDRIQIVFRQYPLPFHDHAHLAAEAAMEVRAQGGDRAFWTYHDRLFQNQGALETDDLVRYAEGLRGVDGRRLRRALEQGTRRAAVDAEIEAGRAVPGGFGTPTSFVNGRMISGAQPYEVFQAAVQAALAGSN